MDSHSAILASLCRVGGCSFASCSQQTSYPVQKYAATLSSIFGIDVTQDDPNIHPAFICHTCMCALTRSMAGAEHVGGGCGPLVTWVSHDTDNCPLCESRGTGVKAKVGRPPKRKAKPRGIAASWGATSVSSSTSQTPAQSSGMDVPLESIKLIATDSHKATAALEICRFADENAVKQSACSICEMAVDQAIQAPCCQSLFCATCICHHLENHCKCPDCGQPLLASMLQKPSKVLAAILSNWTVRCDYYKPALSGCHATVSLCDLKEHVASCAFNPATSMTPIRTTNPKATVEEVLTASPSKLKGNVAGKLMSHLVMARAEEGRVEVKTSSRGKPQVYERITTALVPSDEASARTVRRRSSELHHVAELVGGGAAGAKAQEVAQLRQLSSAEQDKLLEECGLKAHQPAPGTGLAIKADLALPWSQLRKLRAWLKSFGVQIESEHKMRAKIASSLPTYTAKLLPMTTRNGEVSLAPAVFFSNLVEIVIQYLDELHASEYLTWHNGLIPESEIWIKLGGDHGGGSFKLSMQVSGT